jgi:homocysteine S-methyltransferase
MNPFLLKLSEQPLLGDGAMGTMLLSQGASSEQCLEQLVLDRPGWVTGIHQAYASAGADVITTHTFAAHRMRLAKHGLEEKVREINFKAVRLVRDVREVAGRALFVAGDVGPPGKRLELNTPAERAALQDSYREQIGALWEAGADLLLFETFSDVEELAIAVRVAKEICDLPIVASMTYAEDGRTPAGQAPESVIERLRAAGADVVGANCSVGPSRMLEILQAMHANAPTVLLSAMPNAGFPQRVEGRFYYPASPEYFAGHVPQFVREGAHLVGGCCGTTPMHIRAMREGLDSYLAARDGKAQAPARTVLAGDDLPELHVVSPSELVLEGEEHPTGLLRKLRAGKFVISVEVDPPRAFTVQKQIQGARYAKEMGADAVNVADSPMARVRMAALALCTQIQQHIGIETILHFTTRDRSLMGLQADLLGAHVLGVRNVLALTGDPPSLGDNRDSTPVYDVDSIGLVRIISTFNQGLDMSGREMGERGAFTIAVACDPTRTDLREEVDRFHQKIANGAHFAMTQPIYNPRIWLDFLRLYEECYGDLSIPVLIGVLPLQSHRHASYLHHEVPGITLTEAALERMRRAGPNGRQEGVMMAQELLAELKTLPRVQGVYLMPSFGRYELACEVLEVLSAEERGWTPPSSRLCE